MLTFSSSYTDSHILHFFFSSHFILIKKFTDPLRNRRMTLQSLMRAQGMKNYRKIQQPCANVHPFARLRARICILGCVFLCVRVCARLCACTHICMRVMVQDACMHAC